MNTPVEVFGFARDPAWLPWAVQYFFLIGSSTAAFFVSLPGLVWRRPAWLGVSRRALLAALACGLTAPVALLADLHQPGRFLNFYLHPNLQSWMAWGSFFIPVYVTGLLLYAWLSLRPAFAAMARSEPGRIMGRLYAALAYGGHDNRTAIGAAAVLAGIGAALVLTYTGMEVMVVRARPLWNTPVLPLLLAATAFAAGLGMTGLFEAALRHKGAAPLLGRWIERSQWAVLVLLLAWFASALTGVSASAADALDTLRGSLRWGFDLAWLLGATVLTLWLARRRRSLVLVGLMALHGAWLVRWMLLMGGQGLPKMGAAFGTYTFTLTPDSVLGIVGTAGLLLALSIVLTSLVPWDEPAQAPGAAS